MCAMSRWPEGTTLGEAVADELRRRGATYEVAAAEIGTSHANIERWRNRGTVPEGELAYRLMLWLGTDVAGFGMLVAETLFRRGIDGTAVLRQAGSRAR